MEDDPRSGEQIEREREEIDRELERIERRRNERDQAYAMTAAELDVEDSEMARQYESDLISGGMSRGEAHEAAGALWRRLQEAREVRIYERATEFLPAE